LGPDWKGRGFWEQGLSGRASLGLDFMQKAKLIINQGRKAQVTLIPAEGFKISPNHFFPLSLLLIRKRFAKR
jgi:hypothetical protein